MEKFSVGVIGTGKMGLLHSGIFNNLDSSALTAMADKDAFMVSALKNYLKEVNIYQDHRNMIDKEDLDLVVITTPIFLHKQMVEDAMKKKLAIFVEKPLAIDGYECRSILRQNYGETTLVGYCRRFMETYNFARGLIEEEILGKVNHFHSHMFVSQIFKPGKGWLYEPEMSGGGVLVDLGSHAIDLFHHLFGDISVVHALAKPVFNKKVEDYVSANLRFRNGIIGSLQLSWSIRNYRLPELKIEIHLDKGVITATEKYVNVYSEIDAGDISKGWNNYYKQDLKKDIPINIAGPEYTSEDLHLLDCMAVKKKTICDFEEAAKANFVIDALYSSIRNESSQRVTLEG